MRKTMYQKAAGLFALAAILTTCEAAGMGALFGEPEKTPPGVFVPVTDIFDALPDLLNVKRDCALAGVAVPENATNGGNPIVWSVFDAGGTGAAISGNTLTAASPGLVTVRAEIADGAAPGAAFIKDFWIEVEDLGTVGSVTIAAKKLYYGVGEPVTVDVSLDEATVEETVSEGFLKPGHHQVTVFVEAPGGAFTVEKYVSVRSLLWRLNAARVDGKATEVVMYASEGLDDYGNEVPDGEEAAARILSGGDSLVVGPGATLDLAGSYGLTLGDNAALTVNGEALSNAGNLAVASATASPATINGAGTIYLKSQGNLLNIAGGTKLTLEGSVTLNGLNNTDGEGNNSTHLVRVAGELNMRGAVKITGNNAGGIRGGGVGVSGIFNMEGGAVSGNYAMTGGGVHIEPGTFNMSGGEVSDNMTSHSGGGVSVWGGTFSMSGSARVLGNKGTYGGGVVLNLSNTTFNMSGGEVSGNTASTSSGGGVYIISSVTTRFCLSGGTVYGSDAGDKSNTAPAGNGAALYKSSGGGTAEYGNGDPILPASDGHETYTDVTVEGHS